MKLKICGMKYNIGEVADLQPDYLGFIFWKPSKRFFDGSIPKLRRTTGKVGVFVDANIDEILDRTNTYGLNAIQLHGNESPEFCAKLKEQFKDQKIKIDILKVFSIKDSFDFAQLSPYEKSSDFFLFDTKGKLPGGNGYQFNWQVLKGYPSKKPYFLSGGIGLEELDNVLEFLQKEESKYCHAIDVNSRFEISPGLKDIDKLKKFKNRLFETIS
ncbi:phosphoribosylanthranilate isomerase [uncultured Eudoraea sp.]|uniref:phosphoribosylanthranilate isomerase n=1 Tax=uncultured Eudoraea sp. TaxID=1035614 RepID=UPI00260A1991|nr:phosphoribosylanthranilate isomerase [uncultured Eudoraea sp.]